jgi:hypothetical protein
MSFLKTTLFCGGKSLLNTGQLLLQGAEILTEYRAVIAAGGRNPY